MGLQCHGTAHSLTSCFGRLLPGSLMSIDSLSNATAGFIQGNPENSSAACGGAHSCADRVLLCSRSCCCPASRHLLDECGAIPAPCSMRWNLRFLRTIMTLPSPKQFMLQHWPYRGSPGKLATQCHNRLFASSTSGCHPALTTDQIQI